MASLEAKKENRLVVGSNWGDSLPAWLLDEIRAQRITLGLISIIKPDLTTSEKIGDAEVIAYLMTASLKAPLPHTLAKVYFYLITRVMKRKDNGKAIPSDICKTELNIDEERELRKLKSMIYSKRGGDIQHPVLNAVRQLKKDIHKLPEEKTLFDLSIA